MHILTSIDTIGPDSSASRVYGYTALVGIGAGCYLAASFAVGPALVAPEEVNNVVGFLSVGKRQQSGPRPSHTDTRQHKFLELLLS